jgi:hypothetical protein
MRCTATTVTARCNRLSGYGTAALAQLLARRACRYDGEDSHKLFIRYNHMRFNSSALFGFAVLLGAMQVAAQQARAQTASVAQAAQASASDSAVASAQRAADAWLRQVDGAQYGPSWDSAALAFQHAMTRAQWITTIQKAQGQVGPLGARSLQHGQYTTTVPNAPAGEYVVLQYRTESAVAGFVTETVVMVRDGARGWRTVGYTVKPA